jgi:hypothetical protein
VTGDFYYSKGDENKCISIAQFGPKKVHLSLIKCVGFQIAFLRKNISTAPKIFKISFY